MTGPHIAIPIMGITDHRDQLDRIETALHRIEANMSTEAEQLNDLSAKVDDLHADVTEAIRILTEERDNLSPEGQAAFDALAAKVQAIDTEVGDADGSDGTPPPVEP